MRYLLTLSYDGTAFSGWQKQLNAPSIQEAISTALETILQHPIALVGSGRTDAGVHARAQTAHFDTDKTISPSKLLASLNALLPLDIRILTIQEVPSDFHACYSTTGKIYTYQLDLSPLPDPLRRLYSYKPPHPINLTLLKEALPHFIGTHDFTTFANIGSEVSSNIRTIYSIELSENNALIFHGSGFLYKMVRNIVGALLHVAKGEAIDIPSLLSAKDRRLAPPPAPPQALFLTRVIYD